MKTNITIATFIVVILTGWMVVGSILAESDSEKKAAAAIAPSEEKPLPSVRVRESAAEPFAEKVTLRGKTEPSRSSILRAEVGAAVLEIVAKRGSRVAKGDPIIKLDPKSLPQQLDAAKSLLDQRELEFEAAKKLQSSGYQSETRLAEASALLAQAKKDLATTRIALENTVISAPYSGIFNDRLVDVGDFVSVGDPVATFLALDPLVVTAQATEAEIQKINANSPAVAEIDGETYEGAIRYLSLAADSAVRTYTVELEFPNPKHELQAGLTADIVATAETRMAHKVTPAILFLSADTEGELGLKTVDEEQKVHFYKTKIIGSADDGVWVSGLPEKVTLITVGQGYVLPGAEVKAVKESSIQ